MAEWESPGDPDIVGVDVYNERWLRVVSLAEALTRIARNSKMRPCNCGDVARTALAEVEEGTSETCAECHRPIPKFQGATINDIPYCHRNDESPTCYMRASWRMVGPNALLAPPVAGHTDRKDRTMDYSADRSPVDPPKTIGPASDADMYWQMRGSLAEALGLIDDPEKPWTNLVEAVWSLQQRYAALGLER